MALPPRFSSSSFRRRKQQLDQRIASVSAYELPSSLPLSLLSDLVLEIILSKRIAKAKTNKLDEDLSRKSRKLWPTRAIFLNTFLGWALTFITFEWFTLQKAYA